MSKYSSYGTVKSNELRCPESQGRTLNIIYVWKYLLQMVTSRYQITISFSETTVRKAGWIMLTLHSLCSCQL